MALHFYMNGTTGAQDGVEISNGDLSNPLIFDGFNANSGVSLTKDKTIHIRADAGETWRWVTIAAVSIDGQDVKFSFDSNSVGKLWDNFYSSVSSSYLDGGKCNIFLNIVKDENIPITITATVIGGETSPNSNSSLIITGGEKD